MALYNPVNDGQPNARAIKFLFRMQPLEYAKSITDACIGWDDTEPLLRMLAGAVKKRRLTVPADEE